MPAMLAPSVDWSENGTPLSRQYDDPYYSLAGGLAEARHVFLGGNDLPGRFCEGFHIAELGFGTGLNVLAAWAAWHSAAMPGALTVTSFEIAPLAAGDMTQALSAFPELAPEAALLTAARARGETEIETPDLRLSVIVGDAVETLPGWNGCAHAWFLDGFAPRKNPALWSPALMAEVARHSAPGATFATYSAARAVRDALASAGFATRVAPGFAGKRHMSCGVLS